MSILMQPSSPSHYRQSIGPASYVKVWKKQRRQSKPKFCQLQLLFQETNTISTQDYVLPPQQSQHDPFEVGFPISIFVELHFQDKSLFICLHSILFFSNSMASDAAQCHWILHTYILISTIEYQCHLCLIFIYLCQLYCIQYCDCVSSVHQMCRDYQK